MSWLFFYFPFWKEEADTLILREASCLFALSDEINKIWVLKFKKLPTHHFVFVLIKSKMQLHFPICNRKKIVFGLTFPTFSNVFWKTCSIWSFTLKSWHGWAATPAPCPFFWNLTFGKPLPVLLVTWRIPLHLPPRTDRKGLTCKIDHVLFSCSILGMLAEPMHHPITELIFSPLNGSTAYLLGKHA